MATASQPSSGHHADPPRAMEPTPAMRAAEAEHRVYVQGHEAGERRRHVRALIVLGLIVLAFSLVRAGVGRVFYGGWWRQW